MPALLRRSSRVACFFCQSLVEPRDPRSFRCPRCQCSNRYDAAGEIISDEPAMHDEHLNLTSFARRASASNDRLPSMYAAQALFCHTCQTNQMLLANLLSNYLPSLDDPEYPRRLDTLPAYRESVEARYPPVCQNCLPAVEDEIRKRDNMARTSALGGFLRESKGKGRQRQVSASLAEKEKLEAALVMWRVRGCLWVGTVVVVLSTHLAVALGYALPYIRTDLLPIVPAITFLSILWTAWNPTYASMKRDQLQGRAVRQRRKNEYNLLQTLAWLSRLLTSFILASPRFAPSSHLIRLQAHPPSRPARLYAALSLLLELSILVRSIFALRVQRPPAVRLLDANANAASGSGSGSSSRLTSPPPPPPPPLTSTSVPPTRSATPAAEPDLLATLSLSNNPIMGAHPHPGGANPVFGVPSLPAVKAASAQGDANGDASMDDEQDGDEEDGEGEEEEDPDAMDWSPTTSPHAGPQTKAGAKVKAGARKSKGGKASGGGAGDVSWLRPQRFFAPEEPTGLENLFARTIRLGDGELDGGGGGERQRGSGGASARGWGWGWWRGWWGVAAVGVVPLVAVGVGAWIVWERSSKGRELEGVRGGFEM